MKETAKLCGGNCIQNYSKFLITSKHILPNTENNIYLSPFFEQFFRPLPQKKNYKDNFHISLRTIKGIDLILSNLLLSNTILPSNTM